MKSIFSFLIFLLLSTSITHADFFAEEIAGADPEVSMVQDIALSPLVLKDTKEMKRYNSTAFFINSIKTEAVKRFQDGTIPLYRRYDIVTSLNTFTYTMNQYFLYQKIYEQTKKNAYKESARSYLEDSK